VLITAAEPTGIPYVVYGVLVGAALVALGGLAYYYYLLGNDFEMQAIDLLSQQSQRISELEVRLIRMTAERSDLEGIIEGLESAIAYPLV
jgi:hypothetical protein